VLGYVLVALGAMALAAGATPVVRRVASRTGLISPPSTRRTHAEPIPLLGGAAIYGAVVLAAALFADQREWAELIAILGGATVVALLGLLDDHRPLGALPKLAGQVAAAALMVAGGVVVRLTGWAPADTAMTILWMVVLVNAFNFQDNMDGMAGGLGMVAAGWFLLLAVDNGQLLVAPLAAAIMGACAGFLLYNFNPATIFMGDVGSLFLGFVLGALAIKLRFPGRPVEVTFLVPILVLAPILFDLSLVTLSRLRRRVNPFTTAGRDHTSHRLADRGLGTRRAVLTIYAAAVVCGAAAMMASRLDPPWGWLPPLVVLLFGLWALWRLELASGTTEAA
jgi:UDP-GlcNAc:undecaprenyl-phosphate GlcNAc-1-phosphate transferase